jgi:catechol 2,3-dioxygenase-like lactoylglutathione lyase family enzyme
MPPKITDLKAYVPAKDFAASKRFYTALGFTLVDAFGGTVDCDLDGNRFRLQDYHVKEWAENFMMVMYTDGIDEWHRHVQEVVAAGGFSEVRIKPPEAVGRDRVLHVTDPSGVLLVFVQRG